MWLLGYRDTDWKLLLQVIVLFFALVFPVGSHASSESVNEDIQVVLEVSRNGAAWDVIRGGLINYVVTSETKEYPTGNAISTFEDLRATLKLENKISSDMKEIGWDSSSGIEYDSDGASFKLSFKADTNLSIAFAVTPANIAIDFSRLDEGLSLEIRDCLRKLISEARTERIEAAVSLTGNKQETGTALPVLYALMLTSPRKCEQVSDTLAAVGGYETSDFLLDIALNENKFHRPTVECAIQALVKIDDPRAAEKAYALLESENRTEGELGAKMLSSGKAPPDVGRIVKIVKANVGQKTVDEIKQAGDQSALPFLAYIKLLQRPGTESKILFDYLYKSEFQAQRWLGAFTLSGLRDPNALPYLLEMLNDGYPENRRLGVIGIMQLGKGRIPPEEVGQTVERLIKVVGDNDGPVGMEAAKTLKMFTKQNFGNDRALWQQWWDNNKHDF